jgi:hypothetical protein
MKATVQLQLMAADEIMQYIPPATITAIQAKDAHPLFRAYVVGEEGNATPNVIGIGGRVLNWLRASISAMVQRLQFGTKIFHNHAEETNEHSGRTVVGELVGKALEYVGGKMRAVAVAYIYPSYRDIIADAVSIEAEVDVDPSGRSNVVDGVHVGAITGIAVGDRRYNKPAFPAAGLIAQLQAFENQGDNTGGGKMDLTIDQVRDFLMVRKVTPSEVFREDDMRKDKTFQGLLRAEMEMRERLQKEHDALKSTTEEKIAKLKADNDAMRLTLTTDKAKSLAAALIQERKLEPEKSKFILDIKLPAFKVEGEAIDDAAIKGQLNKFVDSSIDEFERFAAILKPAAGKDQQAGGQDRDQAGAQESELLARQV